MNKIKNEAMSSLNKIVVFVFSLVLITNVAHTQDLYVKANAFLNTLTPELKEKTLFKLDDPERYNMYYIPIDRQGPTFHDFNETQKAAALDLLKASVSKEGYRKANEIRQLDNVLTIIENNNGMVPGMSQRRDELNYHFCIFGNPADTGFWGWRFEGHHVSFNFTSTRGKIVSSTPSFLGSNPAIVHLEGHEGEQVLKQEMNLGFELLHSFSESQLAVAKFSDRAPGDIITGRRRKVEVTTPEGISYAAMNKKQQDLFLKLMNVYIGNYEANYAKTLSEKIKKAGYDKLYFGWAGSTVPGKGHYYKISGPVILIEYDNTQNNANHIHTVVRDLTNDYGEDLLREHYDHDHDPDHPHDH